jgi:hypothetical protein
MVNTATHAFPVPQLHTSDTLLLQRAADWHLNMQSNLRRHNGHVTFHQKLSSGSTARVWWRWQTRIPVQYILHIMNGKKNSCLTWARMFKMHSAPTDHQYHSHNSYYTGAIETTPLVWVEGGTAQGFPFTPSALLCSSLAISGMWTQASLLLPWKHQILHFRPLWGC